MVNLLKMTNSGLQLQTNHESNLGFSKTLEYLKGYNNHGDVDNGVDKIREFLSAKKSTCAGAIKSTKYLMQSVNNISKFMETKTPIILNVDCIVPPIELFIPLQTTMKLNENEYYNKVKTISLSSINFKNTHNDTFKHLSPLIFINYYKFLVLQELIPTSKNDHFNVIDTLIRLTSLSCTLSFSSIIPTSSSIEIRTSATVEYHALLQHNLRLPFDWKFFEQLVHYFEYSFIIFNVHDNTRLCYKSRHLQLKKYVVIKYKSPCDLTLYYKSF